MNKTIDIIVHEAVRVEYRYTILAIVFAACCLILAFERWIRYKAMFNLLVREKRKCYKILSQKKKKKN